MVLNGYEMFMGLPKACGLEKEKEQKQRRENRKGKEQKRQGWGGNGMRRKVFVEKCSDAISHVGTLCDMNPKWVTLQAGVKTIGFLSGKGFASHWETAAIRMSGWLDEKDKDQRKDWPGAE